jgi:folate-binding protein YgfZ
LAPRLGKNIANESGFGSNRLRFLTIEWLAAFEINHVVILVIMNGYRMPATPLNQTLLAAGATPGEYRGVQTPARFSDTVSECRALTDACGIYDLGWRAKIIATGSHRHRWLNGMVTNNIKDLPVSRGNYSFLLNPQGRIQGDLYIYNRGDSLLIDTDHSQVEGMLKLLKRYIIMDDVQLADASDKIAAIGLQGPKTRDVLRAAGIIVTELEPMQAADMDWHNVRISVVRTSDNESFELWVPVENVKDVWDALVQAGATPVGAEAIERFRILTGVPRYGVDIRERDLPQETEQMQALNFTKGCYIGQEIVERIRSRGSVHRTLRRFTFAGEPPLPGAKLQADGKEVGEITSVTRVPAVNSSVERVLGLGYIRKEALDGGAKIQYAGGEAQPVEIPFPVTQGQSHA